MKIHRGLHRFPSTPCALTIGNFDGVHRGHQAMMQRLRQEADQRGLPVCVLTFEPHPRDYFAHLLQQPDLAPARITTLRNKMDALAALGIDHAVILPFRADLAALPAAQFVQQIMLDQLYARYVLVGDDFRFGAKRAGDLALLQDLATQHGFEVDCMQEQVVQGLTSDGSALPGVANMGVRPSLDANDVNGGRVLLETHCLQWPAELGPEGGYGKIARVELLHKLHDERRYADLAALHAGIAQDCDDARAWFARHEQARYLQTRRQTTRDRI